MSIANAFKVGLAVAAGTKLAIWSYKVCKEATANQKKLEFLHEKGCPLEKVIFASNTELDNLVKEYA